jgi:hypothetical protein
VNTQEAVALGAERGHGRRADLLGLHRRNSFEWMLSQLANGSARLEEVPTAAQFVRSSLAATRTSGTRQLVVNSCSQRHRSLPRHLRQKPGGSAPSIGLGAQVVIGNGHVPPLGGGKQLTKQFCPYSTSA